MEIWVYLVTIYSYGIYQLSAKVLPQWPMAYTAEGTVNVPDGEISEPFRSWYDAGQGASRLDYYNGTVKTYQLSKVGKYGTYFKEEPVLDVIRCFKSEGTAKNKVMPQSVLPDMSGFKFKGEVDIDGVKAEKWEHDPDSSTLQAMYLYWKMEGSTKVIVPVRYEVVGLDHHYTDYTKFVAGSPPPDTFKVLNVKSCTPIAESEFISVEHQQVYSFNPIQEYIDNVTSHVDRAWENYKRQFNKKYSIAEDNERKNIFRQNMRFITSTNRREQSFSVGVNKMTDYKPEEVKSMTSCVLDNGYFGSEDHYEEFDNETDTSEPPASWNWRYLGAVTPVQDQFECGACWTFSSTGAIEGAHYIKTKNLQTLSAQALLDCSWKFGNQGCKGGDIMASFNWVVSNKRIPLARDYGPYRGMPNFCHVKGLSGVGITKYKIIKKRCPKCIKKALVKYGPISVAMHVNKAFQGYKNRVFNLKCPIKPLIHAVLIVGYGTLNGEDYWVIKNSWGNTWGIEGYALVAIKNNICGLMERPFAIIE